jgi:hypothetical protein
MISHGSEQEQVSSSCTHGNEDSGSIKLWKFIYHLWVHRLSRKTLLHGGSELEVTWIYQSGKKRIQLVYAVSGIKLQPRNMQNDKD